MSVLSLALLQLRRRPGGSLLVVIALTLVFGLVGLLLRVADVQSTGLKRVDPAVDLVIGPKGNALRLIEGGLHLGRYHHDHVRGLTALRAIETATTPPRHVMPLARFAHIEACAGSAFDRQGPGLGRAAWGARSAAVSAGGRPVAVPPPGSIPLSGIDRTWWERPAGVFVPRLASGRWPAEPGEVVLGAAAARQLGRCSGEEVHAHADFKVEGQPVWSGRIEVVGVLARTDTAIDHGAWGRLDDARAVYREVLRHLGGRQFHEDLMTHLLVVLDPEEPAQAQWVFETFHTRRAEVVVVVEDLLDELGTLMVSGAAGRFAVPVLWLAAALLALVVGGRAEAGAQDRGLLRALGYGPVAVAGVASAEAFLLTLAAVGCAAVADLWALRPWVAGLPFGHLTSTLTAGHIVLWCAAPGVAAVVGAAVARPARQVRS